jgi:hypothetical protein
MLLTGEGKVLNDPEIRSFEEGNKLLKHIHDKMDYIKTMMTFEHRDGHKS